uniref:Glycosyl transferase, group 1 family protein n=1 Tax=Babesia bovis TaxID=5865 RepID=S6BNA7_BABBO|nr:glycosyl transferase, group 1 family protein [Babesia bovis]
MSFTTYRTMDNDVVKKKCTILMVSEFFYPDVGGIETHICALSTRLMELGYRVVIVTRQFGERRGIRYMSNGLKVYHIPTLFIVRPCGIPTFIDTFPLARNILIREAVDIVHIHQTTTRYGSEFIFIAYVMGLKTVFTDHSLFSFIDWGPTILTLYLKSQSIILNHIICVSNTHKENLVLRTHTDPNRISVIGNAIESDAFKPRSEPRNDDKIVIVVISRLTAIKGAMLLNAVIPIVCHRHANVNFIIGGDGPYYASIAEIIDKHYLHDRVTLLGTVPNHKVNDVLIKGDIFLNTSKSESFCIAILEAVSSGLLCVATHVGGVHEILPRDMVLLSNYSPESVADRIDDAIKLLPSIDRFEFHNRVREMYSWQRVAQQVSDIYQTVLSRPSIHPLDLLNHYWRPTTSFRPIFIIMLVALYLMLWITDIVSPRDEIDISPDWSACMVNH